MQVSGMDGHPILSEEMPESMTMGEVKGEIAKTDGAHKATIDLHLVDAKPAIEELGPLPDSFTVREVVDGTQELLRQTGGPVQLMMVLSNGADVEHPELVAIKDSDEQGIAAHTARAGQALHDAAEALAKLAQEETAAKEMQDDKARVQKRKEIKSKKAAAEATRAAAEAKKAAVDAGTDELLVMAREVQEQNEAVLRLCQASINQREQEVGAEAAELAAREGELRRQAQVLEDDDEFDESEAMLTQADELRAQSTALEAQTLPADIRALVAEAKSQCDQNCDDVFGKGILKKPETETAPTQHCIAYTNTTWSSNVC